MALHILKGTSGVKEVLTRLMLHMQLGNYFYSSFLIPEENMLQDRLEIPEKGQR